MITNPVLKYYGSKFRLAKWILEHFPAHDHYVEPFGGGGSVLFQKPPSRLETYNDLDGDVVNFFRMLRERADDLIASIRLTPWARSEYIECLAPSENPLENARRLFVRLWMSRAAGTLSTVSGWRRNKCKRNPANDIKLPVLHAAAERLAGVQIEQRDALQLIEEMDSPTTLFYLDPPYVTETRTDKKRYAYELNDAGHRAIAAVVDKVKGFVVLSGYACELYRELFEDRGWLRIDKETCANGGVKRIESLWLSPRTATALG